jgi:hypothetical protein
MIRTIQVITGLTMLLALEVLRVYFIMPFPGSQRSNTIDLAYFLHNNIFYLRTIGWLIIIFPILYFLLRGTTRAKVLTGLGLVLYLVVLYFFNFRFMADKMFYQPANKVFADVAASKIGKQKLVLGVYINNEAKAYPIELIGYHHQVRDTVGNVPVMITYCTVCRTGRVFSPEVDGKPEQFRLVGMDHFNAMFEDATTQSWWRQVSGEAVAGPLKGSSLPELASEQMTLQAWLEAHPDSRIMQPDTTFKSQYEGLDGFDDGTIDSGLEKRDSLSWKEKSWVVGVQIGLTARAYDWSDLLRQKVINDTLGGTAIVIAVEPDSASFHVWNRDSIRFEWREKAGLLDQETQSTWNWQGICTQGSHTGKRLRALQSYQEFWHSWRTFHPQTTQYKPNF